MKIKLCCGKARCPTVEPSGQHDGYYIITDDYNGKVILTRENIQMLYDKICC